MIAQDMLIQIFFFCPSESIFILIENKKLVLDLLELKEKTAMNLYFLWSKGRTEMDRLDLLLLAIEKDVNELISRLLDPSFFDSDELELLTNCANKYNNLMVSRAIVRYISSVRELAISYAEKGDDEQLCNIIDSYGKMWNIALYSTLVYSEFTVENWYNIAQGAAEGGNRELLNRILDICYNDIYNHSLYSSNVNKCHYRRCIEEIAYIAVENGSLDILDDMIERGANNYSEIDND